MTNWERWQLLMRDIPSPQAFVDFAIFSTIAAFLQRRVWTGPEHEKLFANHYTLLVAEPAIGKGRVLKQVLEFLTEHQMEDPTQKMAQQTKEQLTESANENMVNIANFSQSQHKTQQNGKFKPERNLLIPLAPNATTFEALVGATARAGRYKMYSEWDATLQKNVSKVYTHCSLHFCLEEISSLFRKHQENVSNFLITAYDCGDYTYETKTQGTDYVPRCCLNLLGGTTPAFIEIAFNASLMNDGFASRLWPIYAAETRPRPLRMPELTDEQKEAKKALSAHFKKLTNLYGPIQFSAEAWEWLESWWKRHQAGERPNKSDKLSSYYGRKNIHVQKLAICEHFLECADHDELMRPVGEISLATTQRAFNRLSHAEMQMHKALEFEGKNPLAGTAKKLVRYIEKNGPQTTDGLLIEFYNDATQEQLNEILDYLRKTGKLILIDGPPIQWCVPKPNNQNGHI